MQKQKKVARPLLKWAGGKRWFMELFSDRFDSVQDRRWVEPFAGGLACAFYLNVDSVLAGDINPHLINFYCHVKQPGFLVDSVTRTKEHFYALRSEFNDLIRTGSAYTLRGAQLFWLLNRMGFNGLCRFNQKGYFNTPFGCYSSPIVMPQWENYHLLFQKWDFSVGSYAHLPVRATDFIFCDPPYDHGWQGYYETHFSFEKQQDLAHWLAQHPGPGLIMNHATPRILDLYRSVGFKCHILSAPRFISGSLSGRRVVQEVLATHHFSWKDDATSV